MSELRLEAGDWLAEQTQRLEQANHVGADAAGRPEVHNLDGYAAADPVEPPDPLFDD